MSNRFYTFKSKSKAVKSFPVDCLFCRPGFRRFLLLLLKFHTSIHREGLSHRNAFPRIKLRRPLEQNTQGVRVVVHRVA